MTKSWIKHLVYEKSCSPRVDLYHWLWVKAAAVPEVLRPLYESPKLLAQKVTLAVSSHPLK